jgi:hypothetical protein
VQRALAAMLLAVALVWLLSLLATVANYGLRYPAFDQYRLYVAYLGLDFPASALQLENGHRPILPALARIAEVHWFGANQRLQLVLGIGLAVFTMAVIALTAWRGRSSAVTGAAGVLLAVVGVGWLGNARMLIHGNELVHTYLVTSCVVLAMIVLHRSRFTWSTTGMAAAGALATAATFSFGPGMASFVAVFIAAGVLRLPARAYVFPAILFVLAVAVYLLQLPGDGGVRDSIAVRPLDNLLVLLRWLASPWFHAWLAFAEPSMVSWTPGDGSVGTVLGGTARALASLLGPGWMTIAAGAIGGLGIAGYAALLWRAWRGRLEPTRLGVLALGLASFGLATGAIIALARLSYFDVHPMQVMADRYLPWSCLFWLGLALGLCERPATASRWAGDVALPVLALVLVVALSPSHVALAGWSAAVHRNVQQSSVAAQLGIWDGERFPSDADAPRADVEKTLALMRERRLSMFGEPAFALLSEGWRAPAGNHAVPPDSRAFGNRTFRDEASGREVLSIEGWLTRIEDRPRDAALVVVDQAGAIRGLARFSYVGPGKRGMRLNVPAKRGFDGYVIAPREGEALRVLVLDPDTHQVLAEVPLG